MCLREGLKTKRREDDGESRGEEDRKSVGSKLIVWQERAAILWIAGCRGCCWERLLGKRCEVGGEIVEGRTSE